MNLCDVRVSTLSFDHLVNALGIGNPLPRLSWKVKAPVGWHQAAYEVELLAANAPQVHRAVGSDQVLVPWPFAPLTSRQRVEVRVRVQGEDGEWSPWGDWTKAETGLLAASDWVAAPVGGPWNDDPESLRRPSLVRREFTLNTPIASARLYASAHGLYEAEINGHRVGDDALSPGWTAYGQRLRYYTYDVTHLVTMGVNAIGAWLGDGWYRGRIGFHGGYPNLFGCGQEFIAQLEVTHSNGTTTVVASDASWQAARSPLISSGLYEGETIDMREMPHGWSQPGFDTSEWLPAAIGVRDMATMVAPEGPPVRCTETISPSSIQQLRPGTWLLDFGQNLVGRLKLVIDAPAGHRVTIRHAEVLQDGNLYTRPLRGAASVDEFISDGQGPHEWEPRFTIHGFRFAEISGWLGELSSDQVAARVYHSDMRRTGWFECSDPLLNRLHENVRWSMRGNFVDLPTDCPQRDERLGWTGDIQVFAPTAAFLYDCAGFLSSWLKDVAVEQLPDGTVPWYVPVIPGGPQWTPIRPGAGWGDVAVLTPWTMYQRFGDVDVLRTQYESARGWVDLVDRLAGPTHLWTTGYQLGDWLDPIAPPDDPAEGRTDRYLVATAYFAWSTRHLAQTARVLGEDADAARYDLLAKRIKVAFCNEYLTATGRLTSDSATAYSLALCFDLLPDDAARICAGKRLAELVSEDGYRVSTGFVGTPLVCDALAGTGHVEAAYRLLTQTECPSWLYTVLSGGTTIWERWDSQLPDGSVNPGGMTSFNHYALGSVADWMHRVIGGVEQTSPGYRTVRIAPRPGAGITSAKIKHASPYGDIEVEWEIRDGLLECSVSLPTGVSGTLELPGTDPATLTSGVHRSICPA